MVHSIPPTDPSPVEFDDVRSADIRYVDGVAVSYEEWRDARLAKEKERAAQRVEELYADWEAEMEVRGIMFDGDAPQNRSTPVQLRCSCPRAQSFSANIYQLARLERVADTCPRCWQSSKPDNLKDMVESRGGKLLGKYNGSHGTVSIQCENGHEFAMSPANLRPRGKKRGSWCPHCYAGAGERKMTELLAERGCILTNYGGSAADKTKEYIDAHGQPKTAPHTTLVTKPPVAGPARGARDITGYNDGEYIFFIAGDIPPRLPARIARLVNEGTAFHVGEASSLLKCAILMRSAIAVAKDQQCLNVLFNDQWIAPGVYSWGEIEPFANTLVAI